MDTLVINTYAGSLLLGADQIPGANIIGSYEDSGFGVANTKANRARFKNLSPNFQFIDEIRYWPDQDLSEVVVLAHPPCAAFSQQNTSKAKRGTETDAFECTRKVLKYAFTNNAAAVAVESVMGAMAGAWDVHEHMAEAGGYHVYRILKNSILFGVPQYRERFWCVFVRKDLAQPEMTWRLSPLVHNIKWALEPIESYTPTGNIAETVEKKFIARLSTGTCICGAQHGFDAERLRQVGLEHQTGSMRRGFTKLIQPEFFPNEDYKHVCRKHVSPFTSAQPSMLAEFGFAPVLLGSSVWYYRSKPVSKEGYCAIMGFPTDYHFPADGSHGVRTYLSKGVCPPVATWILDNIRIHLGEASASRYTTGEGYHKVCAPGNIVSFRPGRNEILYYLDTMRELGSLENDELIPLRDEEAALMKDDDEEV